MQIVIEISETLKKIADEEDIKTFSHFMWSTIVMDVIKSGIPLPKGHGDLIDRNAFVNKCNADRNHSCYLKSWTADDVLNALQNSYTNVIIKADKEGEGK